MEIERPSVTSNPWWNRNSFTQTNTCTGFVSSIQQRYYPKRFRKEQWGGWAFSPSHTAKKLIGFPKKIYKKSWNKFVLISRFSALKHFLINNVIIWLTLFMFLWNPWYFVQDSQFLIKIYEGFFIKFLAVGNIQTSYAFLNSQWYLVRDRAILTQQVVLWHPFH